MPNWCDNILKITGPEAEVARMRKEIRGQSEFDFETILPTPPGIAGSSSSSSSLSVMPDWFDWRTSAAGWGTKWEVDISDEEKLEDGFIWYFHSAWSPPEGIVFQMSRMYPALRFELCYAESGSYFAGSLIIDCSRVVEDIDLDSRSGSNELYQFVLERMGQDWKSWEEEMEQEV